MAKNTVLAVHEQVDALTHEASTYEFWMGFCTVGGFALGLITFVMAFWQLRKTRKAADAARDAAREAVSKMQVVQNLVTLEQLCSRSRELLMAAKGANRALTKACASELRDALARFRGKHDGDATPMSQAIKALLDEVGAVHIDLEKSARRGAAEVDVIDRISRVQDKLLQLSGGEATRIGD